MNNMWNRIYLLALAVLVLPMLFFSYYAHSWLQSIGSPAAAIEGYLYHADLGWTFLWISSAVLLILSNAVLVKDRRSWAMWLTFSYFAVFLVVRYFWHGRSAIQYRVDHGLPDGGLSWEPVFAVILCAAGGALVYFDQYLVLRLNEKMHPTVAEPEVDEDNHDAQPKNDAQVD
jgi:surface polysaccharide O-acyltransferase-like enzyme